MEDFRCAIDDDYIRNNLRFLLEDEFDYRPKCCSLLSYQNQPTTYQLAGSKTDLKTSWSLKSMGSIPTAKEELSNFVNVMLSNSLETLYAGSEPNLGARSKDKVTETSFINESCNATSIAPKRKFMETLKDRTSSNRINYKHVTDKENINPQGNDFGCKFCLKNGEPYTVYKSHVTKNVDGVPCCPILRKYVCELCGATGDNAHTKKYCTLNTQVEPGRQPFRRLSSGITVSYYNHK